MKSAALGPSTSPIEVTNVSSHGFWLFIGQRELFVAFRDFPWFKEASIAAITRVELPSPHHLSGLIWMSTSPWSRSSIPKNTPW